MTPKKEALYLVNLFKQSVRPWVDHETQVRECKSCAITHIKLLIESHKKWSTEQDEVLEHLNEVKKEIENL